MVFLTLFFYVHPSTVPTRAVLRKMNFLFHIGRFLRMKKHVQFNFVFPPHFMASRDINLNNKDNIHNKLIPAFSAFHHLIRSVKAKLFSITSIFDKDNTTKLEFMNKIITIRSSVRPESFTLTHNHVRINDRSSQLLYHLWSYKRTDVRTFLVSTTKCLTVYRETFNNFFILNFSVHTPLFISLKCDFLLTNFRGSLDIRQFD